MRDPGLKRRYGGAILLCVLVAGTGVSTSAASMVLNAASKGTAASGTVTVNGVATTIRFGYARQVTGFFDPTKSDVEVVLSDVALTGFALTDGSIRQTLAQRGKAHIFEITVDASGKPTSTVLRNRGFVGPSPSGLDSSDIFSKRMLTARVISAVYKSAATHQFFGDTYAFDVAFLLPIVPKGK